MNLKRLARLDRNMARTCEKWLICRDCGYRPPVKLIGRKCRACGGQMLVDRGRDGLIGELSRLFYGTVDPCHVVFVNCCLIF